MTETTNSLGYWIRRRRKALDLTQHDLADAINCAVSTIRKWEADARRPGRDIVERLADTLGLLPPERETFLRVARNEAWPGELAVPDQPADVIRQAPLPGRAWPRLPVPATPMIGRSHDVAVACIRLSHPDVRLLTLTGPGGIGKTRLALQVASDLLDDFAGRIAFVSLAAVRDPALVLPTIVRTLGIPETSGQPIEARLAHVLQAAPSLLVLDTFEHLLQAGPDVAAVLTTAAPVKVLVTSRAALHLAGEHQIAVPPLRLPDVRAADVVNEVARSEAGALFVTRARAAQDDFVLTPTNAPAIAAICTRLDGLPLAIELAAARSKVLAPADLLRRLTPRLPLLTGGSRDLPARQRTIRATIDWSYALLGPTEQALFRRLAVFVDGWTLAGAEAVCRDGLEAQCDVEPAATTPAVIDGLQALLDHSLIQSTESMRLDPDPERRFTMLDLVHEYAHEQLVAHAEAGALQRRRAAYYLAHAEAGTCESPGGPGQLRWIARLEVEQANVRTALQWALDERDGALAVRLSAALGPFWLRRGDVAEGTRWINAALLLGRHHRDVAPAHHAEALFTLTTLVSWGGTVDPALLATAPPHRAPLDALLDACQIAYEELGDSAGLVDVLGLRAWKAWRNEYRVASRLHEEQLAVARATGYQHGIAEALKGLGRVHYNLCDFERAYTLLEESLAIQQARGDQYAIAAAHYDLGVAAYYGGQLQRAAANFERQLALCLALDDRFGRPGALIRLSSVAGCQGEYARAKQLLDAAMALEREQGGRESALALRFQGQLACQQDDWPTAGEAYRASLQGWYSEKVKWEMAFCLEGLGRVAAGLGAAERAARVWGAAAELRVQLGAPLPPIDHAWYAIAFAATRAQVDAGAFTASWTAGRAMTLEQAIAYALVEHDDATVGLHGDAGHDVSSTNSALAADE